MTTYPDTSFLFNIYAPQAHAARAAAHFAAMTEPLLCTSLNRFELINAIQLALFRKTVLIGQAEAALAALEEDLAGGLLVIVPCDWGAVHAKALRIGMQYTAIRGCRGFDVLHVATALELGAAEFLTFDARQGALANAVGLRLPLVE